MHGTCIPYEGQSSNQKFSATRTKYIQVTPNPHLCMEPASPHEGQSSYPSFLSLLCHTSGLLCDKSRLHNILLWLSFTSLDMLALWGALYE